MITFMCLNADTMIWDTVRTPIQPEGIHNRGKITFQEKIKMIPARDPKQSEKVTLEEPHGRDILVEASGSLSKTVRIPTDKSGWGTIRNYPSMTLPRYLIGYLIENLIGYLTGYLIFKWGHSCSYASFFQAHPAPSKLR